VNESGSFERPRAITSVGFLSSGSCAPRRTLASLETLAEMAALGTAVAVESGSGLALDLDDDTYRAVGVTVVDRAEVWRRSEVVFPYRAPIEADFSFMTSDHVIFGYMHAEGNPKLCEALVSTRASAFALEFIADRNGDAVLTAVESMISGQLAVIQAAFHLQKEYSGRGRLLTAVPGSSPTRVLVLGNTRTGRSAAVLASRMGAEVTQLGRNVTRLSAAVGPASAGIILGELSPDRVRDLLPTADVVIGAVLVSDWDTAPLIDRAALQLMRPGSVIVDVTCGYGPGYLPTFPRFTEPHDPFDIVDGIVHIKIDGLPDQVPITASGAASRYMGPAMVDFLRWVSGKPTDSEWAFLDALISAGGVLVNDYVSLSYSRHSSS
jgi:alanine dehydrogenase